MRIAIIGAGNVGSALARACVAAGHTVVLSARHAEHAAKVAADVGGSAAAGIQLLVPQASVVKAFNTVFASRLADPVVDGVPLDGFYAGDDKAAERSASRD